MMSIGVYATLGVFLIIASRNPYAHMEIIWSGNGCITWRFRPKRCGPHAAAALSAALLMYSLRRDDSDFDGGRRLETSKGRTAGRGRMRRCASVAMGINRSAHKVGDPMHHPG
jgi:hypothetical protein